MLEIDYVIVSESDRVTCRRMVDGNPGPVEVFRSARDVHNYAGRDDLFARSAARAAEKAVLALRREPWSATFSTSYQGFPAQIPDRLLGRKVRVTIEDLGPAE